MVIPLDGAAMEIKEIIEELDKSGEVSLDSWRAVSVKRNRDGTVDVLYRNLQIGTDDDPVFLWVYANVIYEERKVRVLERITFKKEDLLWLFRYVSKKKGEGL